MEKKPMEIIYNPGHLYNLKEIEHFLYDVSTKINGNDYTIIKSFRTKPTRDLERIKEQFLIASKNKDVFLISHSLGAPISVMLAQLINSVVGSIMIAPAFKIGASFEENVKYIKEKKEENANFIKALYSKICFLLNTNPIDLWSFKMVEEQALQQIINNQPTYSINIIRAINDETIGEQSVKKLINHLTMDINYYLLSGGGHDIFVSKKYRDILVDLTSSIMMEQEINENPKIRKMVSYKK